MSMKRLTTDKPEGNVENSLNLFYIKDQWTWVRGGGPAPDYKDVSLCDLVRMMVKANIPDTEPPKDDDNLSMMMQEWLMDELDTAEGIIALLYNAGWAFAELRHRLARYEDLEEQGRLVILPCVPGAELVRDGKSFTADHWNVHLSAFREDPTANSGQQVALFSVEEAEKALAEVRDHA